MAGISVQAHFSSHYRPRTIINAESADLTVAFALDYTSAGERLTRSASKDRYLAIPLDGNPLEASRELYRALRTHNASSLNIAGNGLATLAKFDWDQQRANQWVYDVLSPVVEHWPLALVRSGGQTGADLAGLVAAHALGVDVIALLPKGLLQRHADGVDVRNTTVDIRRQIEEGAAELHRS